MGGPLMDTPSDPLAEAKARSKGCPECSGCGLTSRKIEMEINGEMRMVSVSCYCHRCDAGRAVKDHHVQNNPEMVRRIIDLRDHPALVRQGDIEADPDAARYLAMFREFNAKRGRGVPPVKPVEQAQPQYPKRGASA